MQVTCDIQGEFETAVLDPAVGGGSKVHHHNTKGTAADSEKVVYVYLPYHTTRRNGLGLRLRLETQISPQPGGNSTGPTVVNR